MSTNIDSGSAVGVASAAMTAITNTAKRQDLKMLFAVIKPARLSKTRTTGITKAKPKTNRILKTKRM